ncbi:sigma-70 family RNA polymerase sigma factor [Sphingoaurantiacus capsulatus]|uniref:Sigma-70 family RNA polymerase sigma factor n=1 Tax=Sphingoaurantiacus capsulatus TaxID=1771310 RepID=A0ABV7X9L6_9SPHN
MSMRSNIGDLLKSAFVPDDQVMPRAFLDLLDQLAALEEGKPRPGALSDEAFKDQIAAVIPQLRAFGRSLSGSADRADDLVQEAVLRAWAARERFQEGTSFKAWTFTILRNLFLSQMRRTRFTAEWDELAAERVLAAPADQDRHIHVADVQRALNKLPAAQREALVLVGAGGVTYEEAAEICDCPIGTIKSRVARGRTALIAMIEGTEEDQLEALEA